ncbi:MAG: BatD family protein [Acidobacteriota bacterium]
MRRLVTAWLLSCAAIGLVVAEPIEVSVEVEPRTVGQKEPVQVRVVVSGDNSQSAQIDGAAPRGVKLLPAGGISTSTQMSLVNGQMSSRRVFEFTYLPSGLGEGEIPSFSLIVDGQRRRTDPVKVKIVEQSPSNNGRNAQAQDRLPIEVQAHASRRELYVGESLILEYVLRSRVGVQSIEPDASPSFPGFVVEEFKVEPGSTQRDVRDAQGVAWREWTVMRRRLTAAKEGSLAIEAVPFQITVERRSRDFFGMAFPGQVQRVGAVAEALTIKVKPLPSEGRPPDFSGAVGRFTLSTSLAPERVAAGEAANLEITVSGDGSLAGATQPSVSVPPDVDAFDVTERAAGTSKRTWVMPLVPRREGRIEIGGMSFSYFDPALGKYARAEAPPSMLEATPAKRTRSAPTIAAGNASNNTGEIGPFPLADGALRNREQSVAHSVLWWLVLTSPWVVAAASPLAGRWRAVRATSLRGRRARHRQALAAHLAKARRDAASDVGEASREILRALHLWAGDQLGEPSVPLSRAQLRDRFCARWGDALRADVAVALFERAEALRYAGGARAETAAELVKEIETFLEAKQ